LNNRCEDEVDVSFCIANETREMQSPNFPLALRRLGQPRAYRPKTNQLAGELRFVHAALPCSEVLGALGKTN